ncbi:MAG: TIM barrel protein [Spirochaetaceae bacterium]
MANFKFSVGPWNVHEGADPFGPEVRGTIDFAKKVERFAKIGFNAVQFHDDDAVPEIDGKTPSQIEAAAKERKKVLNDNGLVAEFVAPRLWESPRTIDGGFTANNEQDRRYAVDRAKRCADIARVLGCDLVVFWYAREGTQVAESKDPVTSVRRLVEGLNAVLEYDKEIRIAVEPKPNEPTDRSFAPTQGHAIALAAASSDPKRVGGLVESAHAVLAGLDPAFEMAFALAFGKLFSVHLNDQNGLRFDQDKAFGAESLRSAFDQVLVLSEHGYGSKGEYVGLDVKARRTQPEDLAYRHLENSLRVFKLLEEKVRTFDAEKRREFIAARDYEGLEMYVLDHLLGA